MEIRNEQPSWISTSHKQLSNSPKKKMKIPPKSHSLSQAKTSELSPSAKYHFVVNEGPLQGQGDRCPGLVEEEYLLIQKPSTCLTLTWLGGSKSAGTRSVTVHSAALTPGLDTDTHHTTIQYFWSKVVIQNVNCAWATAFIFDTRTNVRVKGVKVLETENVSTWGGLDAPTFGFMQNGLTVWTLSARHLLSHVF